MKKLLAILLSLAMVLAMFSVSVFASEEEPADEAPADVYELTEGAALGLWLATVTNVGGMNFETYSDESYVAATFTAAKPFSKIAIPYWSGDPAQFGGIIPTEVEFALFKAVDGNYGSDYKSEDAVVREVRICDKDDQDFVWEFDQQPAGRYCMRIYQLTEEGGYIVIAQGEPADDDAEFDIDSAMQNTTGQEGIALTIIYDGEGGDTPAEPTDVPENPTEAPTESVPENLVNLALEKEVTAYFDDDVTGLLFDNVWFSPLNLTDGIVSEVPVSDIPTDMPLCWYIGAPGNPDTSAYAEIDLEGLCDVAQIIIYPSDFLKGQNMPSNFEILISEDYNNWVKVAEESGLTEVHTQYLKPFVYTVNQKAAYVMIHITRASCVSDGNYYAGIAEIEVMGTEVPKTPKPTTEPTAEPAATDAPAPTDAPAATDAPVSTDAPAPTEGKTDTDKTTAPEKNDEKKDNTGLIIGIVCGAVALVAVVAGIIVAAKKKKK
ncbi:MAG: discoidin domain-containing protein [Clostridia bacterium]|nr:discoidin domain-containing protein [Clostridia bacterium]